LYLDTFTGYSGSVTLDFNANGVGVTFGEPLEIPPGTFDSGIDKYLPKQDPPPYTAYDTSGFTTVDPTTWNTVKAVTGAFSYKFFVSGPYNIGKGALNIGKELAYMGVDTALGGVTVVTMIGGKPVVFDPWSSPLKALESGNISTGGYYLETVPNIATFGVYGQGTALVNWWNGKITDEEMQQIVGGTAIYQLLPAAVKYGPRIISSLIPKSNTIPQTQYPRPQGWTPEWEWGPASGEDYAPQWRWWDPEGGEWHYHYPDKFHSVGHWDYNPWDHACAKWQNVPDPTGGVTPPPAPSPNLPNQ